MNNILETIVAITDAKKLAEMEANKEKDTNLKTSEAQKSQLINLKELVKMRDTYEKREPNKNNLMMLEKVNSAIKSIADNTPGGFSLISDRTVNETSDKIDALLEKIGRKEIITNINVDFSVKKKKLKEDIKDAVAEGASNEEIFGLQSKFLELEKQRNQEINNQIVNYQKQIDQKKELGDLEKKSQEESEKESRRLSIITDLDKRIALQSDISKFTDESEESILRQSIVLKEMLFNGINILDVEKARLSLAEAISKEMDEQERKSSHMVELAKIAKKYGTGVAQEIALFQGGQISAEEVSGTARRALGKENKGLLEQIQAEEFFRGTGFMFPEDIEKERKRQRNADILYSVGIEPMTINVNLDSEVITDKVLAKIANELEKEKSNLTKSVNKKIEDF